MADNFNYVQAQRFQLAGSGVIATDTTIVLKTFQFPDGTDISMSDFGSIGYAVLEPGTEREENISFTGVTQNADDTADLTGVTRGLKFNADYSQDTNLRKSHAGNSILIISNSAPFYDTFANKKNDETIKQTWTFEKFPQKSGGNTPTADNEIPTKKYVDDTATGTTNYDQNIVSGVAGESLAAGDVVYLNTSDGEWYKADASNSSTAEDLTLGIAQGSGTDGNAITGGVLIGGVDKNDTYTAGQVYYLSDTAGGTDTSAGTVEVFLGVGDANNNLVWQHNSTLETLTAQEKDDLSKIDNTALVTIFTSDGTWNKPDQGNIALIECWGAGGQGAAYQGSSSNDADGATGGGGGEYKYRWIPFSDLSSSVTVTIGTGGNNTSRDTSNGGGGATGGDTSFGSFITAQGGGGGVQGSSPSGGQAGGSFSAPIHGDHNTTTDDPNGIYSGAGGAVSSDTALDGGDSIYGGGGGGSTNQGAGDTSSGGTSDFGGDGGGGAEGANATDGSSPSGGGGGVSNFNQVGGPYTPGAGADGQVRVTVFI